MGSDLASVLWDVLDGYNFYRNFKTTAIGNDRRGLPQPVNRSLFFDEDSEEEQMFNDSDNSRKSQFNENSDRWTSVKNFMLALWFQMKESVIVRTNSISFFYRKACNRNGRCVRWGILLLTIPLTIAGLLKIAITLNTMCWLGGNDGLASQDIVDTNETISERRSSTWADIHSFSFNSTPENVSANTENLSDSNTCSNDCAPSHIKYDVKYCWQQTTELRKKLHDTAVSLVKQSEAQSRSIESLRKQVNDLENYIRSSEDVHEEGTQILNENLETWKKSISNLTRETQESLSALKVNVDKQFIQLAERTGSMESIDSKMADIAKEFFSMKTDLNKKIRELQNHVEGIPNTPSKLTMENIREIVKAENEQKAGEANWIIGVSDHSATHKDSFFSLPVIGSLDWSPDVTVMRRNCWPMDGSQGFIQYELANKVVVSILKIEHLHKSRRLVMGSVPKDFRVEGSPDGGKTWLNLGSNTYNAEGPAVQQFNIAQTSEPLKTIKLFILSNYGERYTCLYGVAVNGKRST